MSLRLHLLGDGEECDILAELARWLGYSSISRGDDAPAHVDSEDHIVVSTRSPARGRVLLTAILAAGDPGYLGLIAAENEAMISLLKLSAERIAKARLDRIAAPAGLLIHAATAGERAIAVAAELIIARRRPTGTT